ncbi:MAG: methyltransferase domain-containing protein [Pseudomonadota bacterium]
MPTTDPSYCYDARAHDYADAHARWLRHVGGEAQCAFEGAAAALLQPGSKMLDAACGKGTVARRLLAGIAGRIDLVLLDAAPRMLAECHDIPARRITACMTDLPFGPNQFDLVTCAWGIEVLDDPRPALREFIRVTRPAGHVCIVFCADRPAQSFVGRALRRHISRSGRGRFLDHEMLREFAIATGARHVQTLHCTGPAAAMIVHV